MGIMANNGTIDSGSIEYTWHDENTGEVRTEDIVKLNEKQMQKEIRGRKIAMVFPRSNDFIESNYDYW